MGDIYKNIFQYWDPDYCKIQCHTLKKQYPSLVKEVKNWVSATNKRRNNDGSSDKCCHHSYKLHLQKYIIAKRESQFFSSIVPENKTNYLLHKVIRCFLQLKSISREIYAMFKQNRHTFYNIWNEKIYFFMKFSAKYCIIDDNVCNRNNLCVKSQCGLEHGCNSLCHFHPFDKYYTRISNMGMVKYTYLADLTKDPNKLPSWFNIDLLDINWPLIKTEYGGFWMHIYNLRKKIKEINLKIWNNLRDNKKGIKNFGLVIGVELHFESFSKSEMLIYRQMIHEIGKYIGNAKDTHSYDLKCPRQWNTIIIRNNKQIYKTHTEIDIPIKRFLELLWHDYEKKFVNVLENVTTRLLKRKYDNSGKENQHKKRKTH